MSQHIIDGTLGFLLNKGTKSLHRALSRNFQLNEFNITAEQWSVLIYLFHCNGKSQNDIAEQTFRDKVSVTKIVDNLERRDLVYRNPDVKDRRINRVFLTENGKAIVPCLRSLALETLNKAFSGIKDVDIGSFKQVLAIMVKNLTGEDLVEFLKINKGRWK